MSLRKGSGGRRPGVACVLMGLSVAALGACGPALSSEDPPVLVEGQLITTEDIARSNARTAWEVLRRAAPHLSMAETQAGEPGRNCHLNPDFNCPSGG